MEKIKQEISNESIKSFDETKEKFLKYCEEHRISWNISGGLFMRANQIEEVYYFILMNNPMGLGTSALNSIYELNLYKRYKFCDESVNVMKWIEKLSREEDFYIASQVLEKQRKLIDIEVDFKGFGYYTLVRIPVENSNRYKIYAKEIEDIKDMHKNGII